MEEDAYFTDALTREALDFIDRHRQESFFLYLSYTAVHTPLEATDAEPVEVATEETAKNLGGAAGWGIAGGLLLGPAGLLAGALLGGRAKKKVTFICVFKDGKKILATADEKTEERRPWMEKQFAERFRQGSEPPEALAVEYARLIIGQQTGVESGLTRRFRRAACAGR